MTRLDLNLGQRGYGIFVGRGIMNNAGEIFNLNRRVFIITDEGVPSQYAECILGACKEGKIFTVCQGEGAKSFTMLESVLSAMLDFDMTRGDCVVGVGGGVVGDLSALAGALYMRGIDFYNVPTTLLADVDSSIGGKCAINLSGVKNTVGTFYQPKAVLIDIDALKTLPKRHISAGLSEALKMSMTSDAELFKIFESGRALEQIEEVIIRALKIKKHVVENDERENGLRKILNFGHTVGHAIESEELGRLYHGECVALGMVAMSSPEVRERLIPILNSLNLPTEYTGDLDRALKSVIHDKKRNGNLIDTVRVEKIGEFILKKMSAEEISQIAKESL